MPVEHSKFIWDIVFYISNLQAFFDFALGCGIPSHMVRKAIEDNDPSDDDISLDDYVAQALIVWWLGCNKLASGSQIELNKALSSCICLKSIPVLLRDTPLWIPNCQYPTIKLAHNLVLVDSCPKDQLNI